MQSSAGALLGCECVPRTETRRIPHRFIKLRMLFCLQASPGCRESSEGLGVHSSPSSAATPTDAYAREVARAALDSSPAPIATNVAPQTRPNERVPRSDANR